MPIRTATQTERVMKNDQHQNAQAEVQALRHRCEELADDVRALSTLVHALRGRLWPWGGKGN
jgi:hypothetical protein